MWKKSNPAPKEPDQKDSKKPKKKGSGKDLDKWIDEMELFEDLFGEH